MSLYETGRTTPLVTDEPEEGVTQTYQDGYALRLREHGTGPLIISLVFGEEKIEYYVMLSPEFVKKAHELLGKHIN